MLEWPEAVKELLASENPSAIVVMLGLNDRQPLRERELPRRALSGAVGEGGDYLRQHLGRLRR
jgi:hypothetical protein